MQSSLFNYIWPIALLVFSNTVYQICAKEVPSNMDTFASMTITYAVGTICSAIMFFAFNRGSNLIAEYGKTNWAPFALGVSVVGLEVGFICAFKNGWSVSTAQVVQAAFLAVVLIFVGALLYKEAITANKIIGIVMCMIGLWFINR